MRDPLDLGSYFGDPMSPQDSASCRFESGWFLLEFKIKSNGFLALPAPHSNLVGFELNFN